MSTMLDRLDDLSLTASSPDAAVRVRIDSDGIRMRLGERVWRPGNESHLSRRISTTVSDAMRAYRKTFTDITHQALAEFDEVCPEKSATSFADITVTDISSAKVVRGRLRGGEELTVEIRPDATRRMTVEEFVSELTEFVSKLTAAHGRAAREVLLIEMERE